MNSETLVERGPLEILNTNQPLNNINNAWRRSFAGSKAVNPKVFESQNFPPKVPTIHRQPEGGESREGHPCSPPQESRHDNLQNPLQAVVRFPKSPIVQSPLPENRPGASQSPLQAVTASSIVQSKSSPENSPSTSQNPVHTNTTIPIVQHTQAASPAYADPRRVPGTDQNIYPRAPIKSEFQERYSQLVDFFKQAVDTHKFLKYHTSKINYELRLCGSTPANAVASVIIFCAEALFKCLRSLLGSKHIRRQYQLMNSSFRDRFQLAPSKPHPQVSAPIVVPFNVVYWREANTPTQRKSAMEQVVTRNHSFLTMCGSLVKYGDRTSTLGLLISMDSKLYGLTVDHLFKNQQGEEQPTIANEAEVLHDEDDSEDSEPEWSWIDDVKYEDLENAECVSDTESVSSGGSHAKITMDHRPNEDYGESINGHKADFMSTTDTTTAYLDWALIEFDDGYYERPNAFFSEEDLANPKFFGILSAAPKTSEVKVFMISGVSGTRKGVMLNSNSYIGGKPSEDLCQAWNVILSDSSRVIDGDCGSLIVDQETLEVYGHVVASSPLGEAYVVPLQNTFHQISSAFGAKDLCLPNPRLLLENLVAHYSQKDDSGVLNEAKRILASMEGPVSKFSPAEEVIPFRGPIGAEILGGGLYGYGVGAFEPTFPMMGTDAPTSWSAWEWSGDRKKWQAYRTNSRGETEWRFDDDQLTSTSSVAANIARFDDTLQLNTVFEDKTQYSVDQNYTRDNKNFKALTDSLTTTSLVPVADTDPPIAANLKPNNTSTEHRNFDPTHEFVFGRVFEVLWSEPTGNARGGTILSVRQKHGEAIHAKVRRVRPIMTYEGRATSKPGVHADEHAIIYTTPQPILIENEDETKIKYHPVKMIPDSNKHKIEAASRINYHKVYTIDYNVKVWFIGRIDPDSQRAVTESFDQAHPLLSQSTQALAPSSYPASNLVYSPSPYTMSGTSSNIPSIKTASN
ncbi:hypothetical protein BPAE_0053g00630 [Botrytis paeoniae]|uniref:DUF6590 domain-containing protein n=1 Tax=Botrytis paeoniae TaxID=278948 RepID=A0A4Z1FT31_9HELO|nr:hypothetical protein BPAE_0053g00630 [Botrytis paeoniae]